MNRLSSTRLRLAPSPPILISSSACVTSVSSGLFGAELLGGPEHRLDDVMVAGAAAEVARQRPPDVLLGRVRVLVQQLPGGHHHARGAEAALQPVLLLEPLLQRVQL